MQSEIINQIYKKYKEEDLSIKALALMHNISYSLLRANFKKEFGEEYRKISEQKIKDYTKKSTKIRICLNCGLQFKNKNPKFCSRSCSASYTNLLKLPKSKETCQKIKDSLVKFNLENPKIEKQVSYKYKKRIKEDINKPLKDKSKKESTNTFNGIWYSRTSILRKVCKCCNKEFWSEKKKYAKVTCSPECARKNSTYRKIAIPYLNNNITIFLESSWELDIAKWLDTKNINWCRPNHIAWVDSKGKSRKYFPDFYLIDYDIYLDPKNDYQILLGKEKLKQICKSITLLFGKVQYIKSKLNEIFESDVTSNISDFESDLAGAEPASRSI